MQDPSEVELANKSSFLWRSLLRGRDIVEKEALWRVGDGKNINVLRDKWIPCLLEGHLILSSCHLPTPMKVSSLIDADRREWNETMVNEMFQDVEASKIVYPLKRKVCT